MQGKCCAKLPSSYAAAWSQYAQENISLELDLERMSSSSYDKVSYFL